MRPAFFMPLGLYALRFQRERQPFQSNAETGTFPIGAAAC